jgi:hypothetical protein
MFRQIIIAGLLLVSSVFGHEGHDHGPHPDDPVKRAEHLAAINLVDENTAILVHGKSSEYQFSSTDDLLVLEGNEFVIDSNIDVHRIRFDGTLRITTNPVHIRVETLVGNTTGHLSMPRSNNQRTIVIKARGERDRIGDPTDISGGIILHSKDNVISGGSPKTSWTIPTLLDTTNKIIHVNECEGWRVGDQLLIPGVKWEDQDELVTISLIRPFGEIVVSSLDKDHKLPDGTYAPVGNLTRQTVIVSENTALSQRGHIMVMHEHTGTNIDGILLKNLGRTTVETTPTKIVLGPDGEFLSGDENTIGRYPLHAHGRSGANLTDVPHQWTNIVIIGSPTHGLVNHGSHVSARNNIVFDCSGSNLFGENGLELGDFTKNLAVLSRGRISPVNKTDEITKFFNFGWEGTLLWLQGPGIKAIDNQLYRAKHSLMEADFTMLPDGGSQFNYPVSYMNDGPHKTNVMEGRFGSSRTKIGIFQVPAFWSGNCGAGSEIGLTVTHVQYDTRSTGDGLIHTKIYDERTKVQNFRMFNVDAGMDSTYIGHFEYRNCRFDGNFKLTNWWRPYNGSPAGTKVHDIFMYNCEFRNFQVGIVDRGWSDYVIKDCIFEDNLIDIQVITRNNIKNSHDVNISGCTHLGRPKMLAAYNARIAAKLPVWGKPKDFWFHEMWPSKGKIYMPEAHMVSNHTIDGKTLYYTDSEDTYIPFSLSNTQYDNLTNEQTQTMFGKTINGRIFKRAEKKILNIDSNIPIYTD